MQRLWDWLVHGFLALWLGAVMPLLCVPGVSSNHTHGPHWAWAEPEATDSHGPEPEAAHAHAHSHDHADGHAHDHAHEEGHRHEPPPPDPAPALRTRVSQPTLTTAGAESVQSALANAVGIPTALLRLPWPLRQGRVDGSPFAPPPTPPTLRPWRPPPVL